MSATQFQATLQFFVQRLLSFCPHIVILQPSNAEGEYSKLQWRLGIDFPLLWPPSFGFVFESYAFYTSASLS